MPGAGNTQLNKKGWQMQPSNKELRVCGRAGKPDHVPFLTGCGSWESCLISVSCSVFTRKWGEKY